MNDALIVVALTLVGISGLAVVASNAPVRQAVTVSVFGMLLAVLFFVLQAPDVALSEVAVGTAIVPLMVMLAIRTVQRHETQHRAESPDRSDGRPR
ncbi:MAG TPA: hydrogenase subunit MbhD domain-containing protein [Acidimicrobiales bacterium]|nr:hydrogenase subunit MbhD domain-containing protein [Acidimicrobiales bacterium]